MKLIKLLLALIFIFSFQVNADANNLKKGSVYSFLKADSMNINFDDLGKKFVFVRDSNFRAEPAIDDSLELHKAINDEWGFFLSELQKEFQQKKFNFSQRTTILMQVYCSKNGEIEFLFYKSNDKHFNYPVTFEKILKKFIKNFKFNMKSKTRYIHSGGVIFG